MHHIYVLLILALWGTTTLRAQTLEAAHADYYTTLWDQLSDHPIDQSLSECVAQHGGTSDVTHCIETHTQRWEKEMTTTYDLLIKLLNQDTPSIKRLTKAQTTWHKYRTQQEAYITQKYRHRQGTQYLQLAATERHLLIRHRTLELLHTYQSLAADVE